jgi:glycosyltransferase involved in cell wall biosynthesis
MRVGFDISQTGRMKAGCGSVAASLVAEFAGMRTEHEFELYPVFGDLYWDPDWAKGTLRPAGSEFRRGMEFETQEEAARFWRNPPDDLESRMGSPDLVHCNNFYCPPRKLKAALVYTVHDLEFCAHPEWSEEANRMGCWEGVVRASAYADRVIAISEYTRRSFLRAFPHFDERKIVAIPLGSRFPTGAKPRKPGAGGIESGQYLLGVSTVEPRKNTARLVRAYARLARQLKHAPPLVLAGRRGWGNAELDRALEDCRDVRIHFTGYVADDELEWLYGNCLAFLLPSLAEGFGLPLLEAMTMGAACLTSRGSATEEVAGDAALLVDAGDEEELAEGMRRLWEDGALVERLKVRGRERANGYGWRKTADRVMEVYEELMVERRGN